MVETLRLQNSRYEYRKFVQKLNACQPSSKGAYESDIPVPSFTEVAQMDALNCFLRWNPTHERFRGELATVYSEVKDFTFDKQLWDKLQ